MPTPLETLRRQYFALVPPYLLLLPTPSELSPPETQQWLLDNLVTTTHPPEPGYRRQFWRKVLPVIEAGIPDGNEDVVINEDLYEQVSTLMTLPSSNDQPQPSFKTFIYDVPSSTPLTNSITLLEEQIAVQSGTTGLRTWTAALHLAHHILAGLVPFPLPPAIELGAGTGFLSILWAQMGGDVIATDLGEGGGSGEWKSPLERMKGNIGMNSVASCRAMALDWADAASWKDTSANGRIVLAADVIYDPDIVPLLVGAIAALIGEYALIAATVRNEETFTLFLEMCKDRGLVTELLDLEAMDAENPTFWDTALDKGTRVEIVRITPMHCV